MYLSYSASVALLCVVPFLSGVSAGKEILLQREETGGLAIPLRRSLNSAVDDNGVVKREVLQAEVSKLSRRVARAFDAYKKRTGSIHPNDKRTEKVLTERGTGGLDLGVTEDSLWYGAIEIGTPARVFAVQFDTGSSDLLLPGTGCTDEHCASRKSYDPSQSSTTHDTKTQFDTRSGDQIEIAGTIYKDTVSIAGLKVEQQAIGALSQVGGLFGNNRYTPDGILGMAFPEISNLEQDPVLQSLIANGVLSNSQFSFRLADSEPELFLGGVNAAQFTGDFATTQVTQKGFWQVALDAINIGGSAVLSNKEAIIDTGSPIIYGPPSEVSEFYKRFPGATDASSTINPGFYTYYCNSTSEVSLTFGGKSFTIPAESFNLGKVSQDSGDCVGAIAATGDSSNSWVVGGAFLRHVYTTFNVGDLSVGFANLT